MQLTIDKEFQRLIPPLQDTEYTQLEENIKANGCQDSLKTWNGVIVDGHNRYKICTANDIPFEVKEMHFEDRDEVVIWIIKNQFGRRNLLPFQRSDLALKMEVVVAAKAKARQVTSTGGTNPQLLQKYEKAGPVHTDETLAHMAGVSRDTIQKTRTILKQGTEVQKQRARHGGKGNSINAIHAEIKGKDKTPPPPMPTPSQIEEAPPELEPPSDTPKEGKPKSARQLHREDMEEIERIKAQLYSNGDDIAYTADDVIMEFQANAERFFRQTRYLLSQHHELFSGSMEKKRMIATLTEAEAEIKEMESFL